MELAQLQHEPFILLGLPHSCDHFTSLFAQASFKPQIYHRSSHFEIIHSMVAASLGFSLLNQKPQTTQTYTGSGKHYHLKTGKYMTSRLCLHDMRR
ncbi:MAG: hypothetical protein E6Q83_08685 [Thiothrix sp.]|nr:MAG: hypothetical protein E6Q83_08685 [Thiothrix sp.]